MLSTLARSAGACLVVGVTALAACGFETRLPEEARIACRSDAECPTSTRCSQTLARCVPESGNQAPTVAVGAIARYAETVSIPVTVRDTEGDDVALTAVLLHAGTEETITVTPDTVTGSAAGTTITLEWNAADHFRGTAYREDLVVRVAGEDDGDRGPAAESQPFAFGNDPPEVFGLTVEPDADGIVRGVTRLQFSVADVDQVALTMLEIVTSDETLTVDLADDANFANGLQSPLPATSPITLLWQTGHVAPLGLQQATLRLAVQDVPLGAASAVVETTFVIDNAPSATLGSPLVPIGGRSLAEVAVPFSVDDPNGPPDGGESVSVSFEYSTDAATWSPATASVSSDLLSGITDFGASYTFVWDALTDAAADSQLGTVVVDTDGDEVADRAVVEFAPELWLRVQPTDSSGLSGSTYTLPAAFPLGAVPPIATLAQPDAVVAGEVTLLFYLADTETDPSDVEVQFQLSGDTVWRAAAIQRGSEVGLASSAELPGEQHLITWASDAAARADSTVPQGIGSTTEADVRLRIRGSDSPDGETRLYGAWSAPITTTVRNQTPPRIENVQVGRLDLSDGSGAVAITYRLADEQGDTADVRVEYNGGPGTTWLPCREYYLPASEGRHGLATAPLESGGVLHTFVWDPTGVRLSQPQLTAIRLTATDGNGSTSVEVTTANSVGPAGVAPLTSPFGSAADYGNAPTSNDGTSALLLSDLNGDGLADVVGTSYSHPPEFYVSLATASGDGTLGAPTFYSGDGAGAMGGSNPRLRQIVLDDFNDDGILDIAATGGNGIDGGDQVAIAIGDGAAGVGNGAFLTPTAADVYDVGRYAIYIDSGDINGDGITDLVTHERGGDFWILLGNGAAGVGDGTFAAPYKASEWCSFSDPYGLELADANGDTNLDIIVTCGHSIGTLLGDGVGDFGQANLVNLGRAVTDFQTLDVDRDGALDVVAHVSSPGTLVVLWGDGNGEFIAGPESALGVNSEEILLVDINGDALDDVVATSGSSSELLVLLGLGQSRASGLFSSPLKIPVGGEAWHVGAGDIDRDGMVDLVAGYLRGPGPRFGRVLGKRVEGIGAATFASSPEYAVGVASPRGLGLGDFNRDGVTDAAVVGTTPGIALLFGQGPGTIGNGVFLQSDVLTGPRFDYVVARDLNHDGLLDLVATGGSVYIYAGRGDGTFEGSSTFSTSNSAYASVPADLNGDGILDLVVGGGNMISLMQGALSGGAGSVITFSESATLSLAANMYQNAPLVADLNGDGAMDIVAPNQAKAQVFLGGIDANGLPTGVFSAAPDVPGSAGRIGFATAADLDDDGTVDLIGIKATTPDFVTHRGMGDGSFEAAVTYALDDPGTFVTAADINADGVTDIIATDWQKVSAWIGNSDGGLGDGTLSGPHYYAQGVGPALSLTRDLNHDGRLDVVTINQTSTSMSVLTGQLQEFFLTEARALQPLGEETAGSVGFVGSMPTASGVDRFGRSYDAPAMSYRLAATGCEGAVSFAEEMREQGGHGLVPLTNAWQATGSHHLRRELDPSGVERLRLDRRLGPLAGASRAGLDVSAADLASQHGVVVDLPLLAAHKSVDPARVGVHCCYLEYQRVSDAPQDPMYDYLPNQSDGSPIVDTRAFYEEVAADTGNDFPAGVGRRYILDAASSRVRVLTDRFGVCQGFLQAP